MRLRRAVLLIVLGILSLWGMPSLIVTKTPFEIFNCGVDFTGAVGTDVITLVSVTSVNVATRADSTAVIIAASPAPAIFGATKTVIFTVQAGNSGETHLVSARINDVTTGEKFEGQIRLQVNAGR
jgi:hypothetical protein